MYAMDAPSHNAVIPNMIASDPDTFVVYSNSTEFIGETEFDLGFSTISGDMMIVSDFLNESFYNFTDTFTVNFYIDDYLFDYKYISNASDYAELTSFNLPLNWIVGDYIDFKIEVVFDAIPHYNINETLMDETIQGEIEVGIDMGIYPFEMLCEHYGINQTTDLEYYTQEEKDELRDELYYNFRIEEYHNESWDEYALVSSYDFTFGNISIIESYVRDDAQVWNVSSDLDGFAGYSMNANTGNLGSWQYLNESVEEMVNLTTVNNDFVLGDYRNLGFSLPNTTTITRDGFNNVSFLFTDLFVPEQKHWNITRDNPNGWSESVFRIDQGYQLPHPSLEYIEGPTVWDHSVRACSYDYMRNQSTNDFNTTDATYIGLYEGDSISILNAEMYLPWQANYNGSLLIPEIPTDLTDFEVKVQFDFQELTGTNLFYEEWIITEEDWKDGLDYVNDWYWVDLSLKFPSNITSHMVSMNITVTLNFNTGHEGEILPIYLTRGYITGEENVLSISNAYPEKLRERMFSTNFLYFYTFFGKDIGLTENNVSTGIMGNDDINDIKYILQSYDDFTPEFTGEKTTYMRDLTDILNVKDEVTYLSTGTEINQDNFDQWFGYEEGTEEIGNYETYVEFADQGLNATGISMMAMKFRPELLAEIEDPVVYSGFLSLYDIAPDPANMQITKDTYIKSRKITVIINPSYWNQTSQRTVLSGPEDGSPKNSLSTDLSEYSISINNSTANYTQSAFLSYYLAPSPQDIIINDWSARVFNEGTLDSVPENHAVNQLWDVVTINNNPTQAYKVQTNHDERSYYQYINGTEDDMEKDKTYFDVRGNPISSIPTSIKIYIESSETSGLGATSYIYVYLKNNIGDWDEIEHISCSSETENFDGYAEYTGLDSDKYLNYYSGDYNGLNGLKFEYRKAKGGGVFDQIEDEDIHFDYIKIRVDNDDDLEQQVMWDDPYIFSYDDIVSSFDNSDDFDWTDDYTTYWNDDGSNQGYVGEIDSTSLFMVNISNWKNNSVPWTTCDTGEFEYRDTFTLELGSWEDGLYSNPTARNYEDYQFLQIPLYFLDVTPIDYVKLQFIYSVGESEELTFDYSNKTNMHFENIMHEIDGKKVWRINFDIGFNDLRNSSYITQMGLAGLALYLEESIGTFTVIDNNSVQHPYDIFPTPFIPDISSYQAEFGLNFSADISSLKIESTSGFNTLNGSDLNIYSIFIGNISTNESEYYDSFYQYNFDNRGREIQQSLSNWYLDADFYDPWETTGDSYLADNNWLKQENFDFNGDSYYDLIIQSYDGEGEGVFDNGILDTFLFDFNGNGIWDYSMKMNIGISISEITDPADSQEGYCFITKTLTQSFEESFDINEDGSWDQVQDYFRYTTSDMIPNFREYEISGTDLVSGFDSVGWGGWIYGITSKEDTDYSGDWNEVLTQIDLWPNSDWVMDDMHQHLVYETFSDTVYHSDPIYNESDPEQLIGYDTYYLEETGNTLEVNASFYLPHTGVLYRDENNNLADPEERDLLADRVLINSTFIIEYYDHVPYDPRMELPIELRTTKGAIFWEDRDSNGYYETGYIMDQNSMQNNQCIGIYISRSGKNIPIIDEIAFEISGDSIIPLYWLDERIAFDDITNLAWDTAVQDYLTNFNQFTAWIKGQDSDFWANNALDTIAQVAIGGTSAIIAMVPVIGPVLAYFTTMIGFSVYQYIARPYLIDKMEENNLLGMSPKPKSIRKEEVEFSWDPFAQGEESELPIYTSGITYKDSTPFWDNTPWLEPDEPDVDPDGDGYWDAIDQGVLDECTVNVPAIGNRDYYHLGFIYWLNWFKEEGRVEIIQYIYDDGFEFGQEGDFFENINFFEFMKFLNPDQDSSEPADPVHLFDGWDEYNLPTGPDLNDLDYYSPEEIITIKIRIWRFLHYYYDREWDEGYFGSFYNGNGYEFVDDVIHHDILPWYSNDYMTRICHYDTADVVYGQGTQEIDDPFCISKYTPFTAVEIEQSIKNVTFKGYGDAFGEVSALYYEKYWRNIAPDSNNEVGVVQGLLDENSEIYKDFDIYVQSDGRPVLVPSTEVSFNASDPIDRALDFFKIYFLSKYQGEYEYSYMNSNKIQVRNLIVQGAQIIITMLVTHGIGKIGEKFMGKIATRLRFTVPSPEGLTLLDIGKELFEEMVLENVVSSAATSLGFSDDWANILGESVWSFTSVIKGTIGSWRMSTSIVTQTIQMRKAIRQKYYNTKTELASIALQPKTMEADYHKFIKDTEKANRIIKIESKILTLKEIAHEMKTLQQQLRGYRRTEVFKAQINQDINNKFFILDHINAHRIDPSKFENTVENLNGFQIKDFVGKNHEVRRILLKYLMIHLHDPVRDFVNDKNMLDELGMPPEKFVYFKGTFGAHTNLIFSSDSCPNALVIDLIQNLQDLTIVDPIHSSYVAEIKSTLYDEESDVPDSKIRLANELMTVLKGPDSDQYFKVNPKGTDLPDTDTILGLERVCEKIDAQKGAKRVLRIDPNSPMQKNDLFGTGGLLIDKFPDEYNPTIVNPVEIALPADKIYLINYMHPLLLEARINGELLLSTADRVITIQHNRIIYNPTKIETELHSNNVQNWDQFDRARDFTKNMIIFGSVIDRKISTLKKILDHNPGRSDRDIVEKLWETGRIFETIMPGLGLSIINWILPIMDGIPFSEWLQRKTSTDKWYDIDIHSIKSSELGFSWAECLRHPSNIDAAREILAWLRLNSLVLEETLYHKYLSAGVSPNTKIQDRLITICNNILAIEGHSYSLSDYIFDHHRDSALNPDIAMMLDKATSHFKRLFEIWKMGNIVFGAEIPSQFYGIGIDVDSRVDDVDSSEDIFKHWSYWLYELSFDYDDVFLSKRYHYYAPYYNTIPSSEYNLDDLLFFDREDALISFKAESNLRYYPFDTQYISGDIAREVALSRIEFEDSLTILKNKKIGHPDSPIAYMGLPTPQKFLPLDSAWNYRTRNDHPLDRLSRISRIKGALEAYHDKIYNFISRKMTINPLPFIGTSATENWNNFLHNYGDEIITIPTSEVGSGRTLTDTIRHIDTYLLSENKPIFYDWLLALKNKEGKITDLVAIERLGGYVHGYIERKDWDAGQYIKDKMPMIYVVNSPADKLKILQNCKYIGKDFPVMTTAEFNSFITGMHHAYDDLGSSFSLENYIKSLFLEVDGEPNWRKWGMTNTEKKPYAQMIQGSFGFNEDGAYIHTDSEKPFAWEYYIPKKDDIEGHWSRPINYNWGERLQNNYWQFSAESLLRSIPYDQRKLYDQFNSMRPDFVHVAYDWTVWYG